MKISTDIFIPPIVPGRTNSVILRFDLEGNNLSIEEFWGFCVQNDKLQIELTKENEITITFSRGFSFSQRSLEILLQLGKWQDIFQTGEVFNHLVGYALPSGLIFSPSFSWIKKERFESLSEEKKEKLIHLCPDFVIELCSAFDKLKKMQVKMREYIRNGAQLGWLINPKSKQVFIYRPNSEVEILRNPEKVSGEPLLTGFELDLTEIW
jgi:Uma2 family endonuclease